MVARPTIAVGSMPALPEPATRQHTTIDEYYSGLGPDAPIKSLAEEIADNSANAHEALKFGNGTHADVAGDRHHARIGGLESPTATNLLQRQDRSAHKAIDE